jgi:hypothetical protein
MGGFSAILTNFSILWQSSFPAQWGKHTLPWGKNGLLMGDFLPVEGIALKNWTDGYSGAFADRRS